MAQLTVEIDMTEIQDALKEFERQVETQEKVFTTLDGMATAFGAAIGPAWKKVFGTELQISFSSCTPSRNSITSCNANIWYRSINRITVTEIEDEPIQVEDDNVFAPRPEYAPVEDLQS